jgi:hypothetical protein
VGGLDAGTSLQIKSLDSLTTSAIIRFKRENHVELISVILWSAEYAHACAHVEHK